MGEQLPHETSSAKDLIIAAEGESSTRFIMVGGDAPAEHGYDQELAEERARRALRRVLDGTP